eukprot:345284-Amorphochlora_amoeboformis.AAC.2
MLRDTRLGGIQNGMCSERVVNRLETTSGLLSRLRTLSATDLLLLFRLILMGNSMFRIVVKGVMVVCTLDCSSRRRSSSSEIGSTSGSCV